MEIKEATPRAIVALRGFKLHILFECGHGVGKVARQKLFAAFENAHGLSCAREA
jgi:hypothetical protein